LYLRSKFDFMLELAATEYAFDVAIGRFGR